MESWSYHRYLRGLWHAWLPPLVLWVPEGYPPCGALWRPVAPCGTPKKRAGTPIERIADIDAWRPEASMPGWPGWLAWLAGWLGWLAWLAELAWLDERMRKVSHARRSEEVGGFVS